MPGRDEAHDVPLARPRAAGDRRDRHRGAHLEATEPAVEIELGPGTREDVERVGAQDVPLARHQRELVLVERDPLVGHQRRPERHALARDLAALHPGDDPVDELARLARQPHELPVVLGLADDLLRHALAGGLHVAIEALAAVLPQPLRERRAEAHGRDDRDADEREDKALGEAHGDR